MDSPSTDTLLPGHWTVCGLYFTLMYQNPWEGTGWEHSVDEVGYYMPGPSPSLAIVEALLWDLPHLS